jgi:hypothetical protein
MFPDDFVKTSIISIAESYLTFFVPRLYYDFASSRKRLPHPGPSKGLFGKNIAHPSEFGKNQF